MKRVLITILLLLPCNALTADSFFFDNGVGGASNVENGIGADDTIGNKQADNITPVSDVFINEIQWTGTYSTFAPVLDDFSIEFYLDDGTNLPLGPPVAIFDIGNTATKTDSGFNVIRDIYDYSVEIAPLLLDANTTYWLSITNNTTDNPGERWFWGTQNFATNDRAFSFDLGETWTASTSNTSLVDFRLIGETVPEPQSVLVLTFLASSLLVRRKR